MMQTEFINAMRGLLADELPDFLRAMEEAPALAMRINPLRPGAFRAAEAFLAEPVPWAKQAYYLKPDARPGASFAHDLGAFYLQEASAMVSASVLDAQPGEKILDLCAAPGGKTTQIAGAMMGEGLLISNEPVPGRARVLAENLERMGVVNAVAVCAYPDQLAKKWPEAFDGVLVDAPCSGEGMFRRDPASRGEWQPGSPAGCAKRQAEILDSAAGLVRPGGRLVYSTCTFNRTENEGSIEGFLSRHPEFHPEPFALDGIGASCDGMLRVWPHRVRGDGHFVAKLRKDGCAEGRRERKARRRAEDGSLRELFERLERESCAIPECLAEGRLIRQADYVHVLPKDAPEMDGIRMTKPGLCVMKVGRSHVQPMPALARACGEGRNLARAKRQVELTEEEMRRVRLGERLEFDREPGWTLMTWMNLPVGFVKVRK